MTNFHAKSIPTIDGETWQPIRVPARGQDRTAFHAFVLLPGLSISFLAAVLERSRSSVSAYRRAARKAAQTDPAISEAIDATVWTLQAEHGLQMSRLRGRSQLPIWSRLAIRDYGKRGFTRRQIANAFGCSVSTVNNVLGCKAKSFPPFLGERKLTNSQQCPPNMFGPRSSQHGVD